MWSAGPAVINTGLSAVAWPLANRALFLPFRLPMPAMATRMCVGIGATTGNFDVGIYDRFGNRLVSSGSQTKPTASAEQIVDITDTYLQAGLYFMALAANSADTFARAAPTNVGMCKLIGMREMASAFALPATATFATVSSAYVPMVGVYLV